MQGRRLPDGSSLEDFEPGDYGKRGSFWWVCLPTGVLSRLDGRWSICEHDDTTITVSPSIHDSPDGWHGYLERGVWRPV